VAYEWFHLDGPYLLKLLTNENIPEYFQTE
jgi:hypothetical protein